MEPEAVGSRATVCPTCSAPVEPDWLTCRSCGAILAAVRRTAPLEAASLDAAPTSGITPATSPDPATSPPSGAPAAVPGWPAPPPPPAEPLLPSSPPVHSAAIAASVPPPVSPELPPNQWYSSRATAGQAEVQTEAPTLTAEPKAGILADLPLVIPGHAGGHLAAVGMVLIAVAFFLPWSPLLPGISLFDVWGFGRSSRIVVLVADLVLLFLALQPVGLSARVRTGWLPTFFGIFVVGVFWERVDAISVVGFGAWLFAIGGLLSFIGGLLTLFGQDPQAPGASEPPVA